MPQAYSISNQNGPAVSRGHNIRDPRSIKNQEHIMEGGEFEIWHDEKPREAYKRLFQDSVNEYNTRVKKSSRIDNYYKEVSSDKKKNVAYEVIMTIGNRNFQVDKEVGKEILKEFVDDWQKRNPNLEMIGAYYHADEYDPETGIFGTPHVHIDYVPVAHNCTRGPKTQNSLRAAFEEMGYYSSGPKNTAQMKWQRSERAAFEKICNEHGISIAEKKRDERHHLDTDIYKKTKKLESLQERTGAMEEYSSAVSEKIRSMEDEIDELTERLETIRSIPLTEEQVRKEKPVKNTPDGNVVEVPVDEYMRLRVAFFDAMEEKKKREEKDDEYARLKEENEKLSGTLKETSDSFRQLGQIFKSYKNHVKEMDPKLNEEANRISMNETMQSSSRVSTKDTDIEEL
jgi:hypothetical protein